MSEFSKDRSRFAESPVGPAASPVEASAADRFRKRATVRPAGTPRHSKQAASQSERSSIRASLLGKHLQGHLPGTAAEPDGFPSVAPVRLLITRDEAAALLCISPRKLWSMTNAGQIPCVRMGRTVRYCPTALREWVERSVQ